MSISKQLLILGASVRAAAQSAIQGNFCVTGLDLFGDADLQRIATWNEVSDYPEGFIAAADSFAPRSWMYTGGLENYPLVVEAICKKHRLLGNSAEVLREVRDPHKLAEVCRGSKFNTPRIVAAEERHENEAQWLCKSRDSSGGLGVRRYRPHRNTRPQEYLQEWIDGESQSAVFIAANRQAILLGVTSQLVQQSWLHGPEFQYAGSIGPLDLDEIQTRDWQRLGQTLADAFRLRGLFGVDCVVNDNGIWPLEVNPRFPASVEVLERALSFSAVALHYSACLDEEVHWPTKTTPNKVVGKGILYAPTTINISEKRSSQWFDEANFGRMADIPLPSTIEQNKPMTTVLAEGSTTAEVLNQLQTNAANCYQQLAAKSLDDDTL